MKRLLRKYVRELLSEGVLSDVPGLTLPTKPETSSRTARFFDYGGSKEQVQYRRAVKKAWNAHADHSYWQNPNNILVVHRLGMWSNRDSLIDYFNPSDIDKMIWKKALKLGIVSDDYDPEEPYLPPEDLDSFYNDKEFYKEVVSKAGGISSLKIPGLNIPSRDELSCMGYPQPVSRGELRGGPYFTFKKYRVTFASDFDAGTERLSRATRKDKEKHKSSGLPKRPAMNIDLSRVPLDAKSVDSGVVIGEVVIDNWIIDEFYGYESDRPLAERLGIKFVRYK